MLEEETGAGRYEWLVSCVLLEARVLARPWFAQAKHPMLALGLDNHVLAQVVAEFMSPH